MNNSNLAKPKNPDLIQSYINALTNLVSMDRAKYAAKQSEQDLMQGLGSLGVSNGIYLTSDDIPAEFGDKVVRDSVNAHLVKIQSEQISQATIAEVSRAELEANKLYIGKKIQITIDDRESDVVDAVYLDSNSSNYRVSKYNAKKIKGTIEEISFKNNLLVIKPTLAARLIVPSRVFIHVYVINLDLMKPNISIG